MRATCDAQPKAPPDFATKRSREAFATSDASSFEGREIHGCSFRRIACLAQSERGDGCRSCWIARAARFSTDQPRCVGKLCRCSKCEVAQRSTQNEQCGQILARTSTGSPGQPTNRLKLFKQVGPALIARAGAKRNALYCVSPTQLRSIEAVAEDCVPYRGEHVRRTGIGA